MSIDFAKIKADVAQVLGILESDAIKRPLSISGKIER